MTKLRQNPLGNKPLNTKRKREISLVLGTGLPRSLIVLKSFSKQTSFVGLRRIISAT